jgi:hypothetical protein
MLKKPAAVAKAPPHKEMPRLSLLFPETLLSGGKRLRDHGLILAITVKGQSRRP